MPLNKLNLLKIFFITQNLIQQYIVKTYWNYYFGIHSLNKLILNWINEKKII